MTKKLLVVVMLGALSGVAQAQSSVTLYGIIDEGFLFSSNSAGGRQYALQSSILQASRWGLRGAEDLGGGLKSIFVLEGGFDPSTGKLGQGGLLFGRQAYVGISSPYGTVTLGRQYDSVVDFLGILAVSNQWGGAIVDHAGDVDNFNNSARTNNAIKFSSEQYAGFKFSAVYSLGGVAGDVSRNQVYSFGLGYQGGPLVAGVAYLNVRNPNVSFFGNSTSGTASPATANIASPIYSGFASAHSYQNIAAGAALTFGSATFGANFSNVTFNGLGDLSSGPNPSANLHYSGKAILNNAEVSFRYQVTSSTVLGVGYEHTNVSSVNGVDGSRYNQFEAGADYFLSKRTDVYLIGVYQKASGINSRGAPAVAALNLLTPSSNDKQGVVRVGIRHKF
ncbi:porin [Paraburkholderia caribensis]|uniref:porin n=1 Tax=Paraburkholderia caribensis TaxID=75105 RepID=UPI001CB18FFF|nr:porin [Paraburkholderia caribensis]CAG9263032.1 Outer membrane protein (Porin) [Paraburkholderia caribensis]